jgi:hypothetical protein
MGGWVLLAASIGVTAAWVCEVRAQAAVRRPPATAGSSQPEQPAYAPSTMDGISSSMTAGPSGSTPSKSRIRQRPRKKPIRAGARAMLRESRLKRCSLADQSSCAGVAPDPRPLWPHAGFRLSRCRSPSPVGRPRNAGAGIRSGRTPGRKPCLRLRVAGAGANRPGSQAWPVG